MQKEHLIPEGFPTYTQETIAYFKDGVLYTDVPALKIMVSDESDLSELTDVPIGSEAFTDDETKKWRLGLDGTWVSTYEAEES